MKSHDHLSPEERASADKIKEAYMKDEGLAEDQATARAVAELNRLAGRTDGSFSADPQVRDKKGGFQTDGNHPVG